MNRITVSFGLISLLCATTVLGQQLSSSNAPNAQVSITNTISSSPSSLSSQAPAKSMKGKKFSCEIISVDRKTKSLEVKTEGLTKRIILDRRMERKGDKSKDQMLARLRPGGKCLVIGVERPDGVFLAQDIGPESESSTHEGEVKPTEKRQGPDK